MRAIPTVIIQSENGPVRINESDYDKSKHKLAKDAPAKAPTKKKTTAPKKKKGATKTITTSKDLTVKEIDGTHFIVEADGTVAIVDLETDQKGHETAVDAWNALSAFQTNNK